MLTRSVTLRWQTLPYLGSVSFDRLKNCCCGSVGLRDSTKCWKGFFIFAVIFSFCGNLKTGMLVRSLEPALNLLTKPAQSQKASRVQKDPPPGSRKTRLPSVTLNSDPHFTVLI